MENPSVKTKEDNFYSVLKTWLHDLTHTDLLHDLQRQFEISSSLDDDDCNDVFHLDDEMTIKNVVIDTNEDDNLSGNIYFQSGCYFHGQFSGDLSWWSGKMFPSVRSERGEEGTWFLHKREGLVVRDTIYGGWEESFYRNGVRHGVCLEIGPKKDVVWYGVFKWGQSVGTALRRTIGGCCVVGCCFESKISDNKALFLLPDLMTGLQGVVVEDVFVRGKQVEVLGVDWQDGVPLPKVSDPLSEQVVRRDVSTGKVISMRPLEEDCWEYSRVEARASRVEGAGEGLFAIKPLYPGNLVALYNGTRNTPSRDQEWSDYRVHLNGDIDIDIPPESQNLDNYRATLSHKANHSFSPNCSWGRIDHPRFGLICSLVARQPIHPGEEVTVNYRLPLHLAPAWYKSCWNSWKQEQTLGYSENKSQTGEEEGEEKEEEEEDGKEEKDDGDQVRDLAQRRSDVGERINERNF